MKILKSLAVFVAVCMMLSVIPVITHAAGGAVAAADEAATDPEATADPNVTADPDATPEITTEPDATDEPSATNDPDATDEPSVTADPDATELPDTTADPDATTSPDATADPSATADPNATATPLPSTSPSAQYKITINPTDKSTITAKVNSTQVTSANSGTRVTITGKADRGNNYSSVYYENSANEKTDIITNLTEQFEQAITMPSSDIVIYAETKEMTPQQLYTSATRQYTSVNTNITTYKTRYINNSTNYNASDIREMNLYISEAEELLPELRDSYTNLNALINDSAVTDVAISDVIYMQKELDRITNEMDRLAQQMGGDADSYDLDVNLTRGGRVTISGAVSSTVDAYNGAASDIFTNIPADSSLTFRIQTQTGYTLNYFRINSKNVSMNGNSYTIAATNIRSFISNGRMEVSISFTQNYGGTGYGGTGYGGTGYGGGTTYNNYNNLGTGGVTSTAAPGAATGSVFNDLAGVEWAVPSITALYNMGIINGMGDGRFEPQSNVTREQFAKMIVGVMGYTVDQNATTSFSDANGDWYTPYIAAAVQNGIINGRDDGTFGVGDNITRQDIAVIIYRTQGSPGVEIHEFPDSANISDYAVEAVSYLFSRQIATGDDQGNFNPVNPATRAEASKMLYGLYTLTH